MRNKNFNLKLFIISSLIVLLIGIISISHIYKFEFFQLPNFETKAKTSNGFKNIFPNEPANTNNINLYNNHTNFFNSTANLKNRKLSTSLDFFTQENVKTINGHVPMTSCPMG